MLCSVSQSCTNYRFISHWFVISTWHSNSESMLDYRSHVTIGNPSKFIHYFIRAERWLSLRLRRQAYRRSACELSRLSVVRDANLPFETLTIHVIERHHSSASVTLAWRQDNSKLVCERAFIITLTFRYQKISYCSFLPELSILRVLNCIILISH